MKVKELINKLKKLNEESEVFVDSGLALNILEAESVIYDKEEDIAIISVVDIEGFNLEDKYCKII